MTARQVLWETAVEQYGYITVRDLDDLSISRATLKMLAARGTLERVAAGVYRFPELPVTEYDASMLAVLWTGEPRACLSHETALANHDVCDINPDRTHLTVPRGRRIRRSGGDLYVVHQEDVPRSDIGWWHRVPMVKLPRAIIQCIDTGVPSYLIGQALENGERRGLLLREEIEAFNTKLEDRNARR